MTRGRGISERAVLAVAENRIRERGVLRPRGRWPAAVHINEPYEPNSWINKWMKRERFGPRAGEALAGL